MQLRKVDSRMFSSTRTRDDIRGRSCSSWLIATYVFLVPSVEESTHYFLIGTLRFSSSNQFITTLICAGAAACSLALSIRKRWPSGLTE